MVSLPIQATARASEEPLTQCFQRCSQGNCAEVIVRQHWENRKQSADYSENFREVYLLFRRGGVPPVPRLCSHPAVR